jgi:hypothetical protein
MLTRVMIIRHAEKPEKGTPPHGVTSDGERDEGSLTVRGWQRAGALVSLFCPSNNVFADPLLAAPTVIYASSPDGGSHRPLETVKPLHRRLGVELVKNFAKGQEDELAAAVVRESGVVLISWQHERIAAIAEHLTADAPPRSAIPRSWPDDRFDMVWVLLPPRANAGVPWTLHQVPQLLLAGDTKTVFA